MRWIIVASGWMLLAGCATTPVEEQVVDAAYVAKINQGARLGGGQVIWLQYPTVRKPAVPPSS